MKKSMIIIILTLLMVIELSSSIYAQKASINEAEVIANNWISLMIQSKGSWGGALSAEVVEIQQFILDERTLGYFCQVNPQGFIITSLHMELAPVKAYSATCDIDPGSNKGIVDLIKGKMERILITIEQELGPLETASSQDIQDILEINYRQAWDELKADVGIFNKSLGSGISKDNYQEGEILLSSSWKQGDPYNASCPLGDGGRTVVGCVATAGSQIMKYWNWPPYGDGSHSFSWNGDQSCEGTSVGGTLSATFSDPHNWPYIANQYVWNNSESRWEDENGNPLTSTHLDAIAELSYEVGVAAEMDYGVCGSGTQTWYMEGVFENHYRYDQSCIRRNRPDYSAIDWFDLMKTDFNLNRPIQYRILGHSIVADGWQEIGTPTIRQYHMNYGWDNANNAWYTLDALFYPAGGTTDDEYILEDIFPVNAIGSLILGGYPAQTLFRYRYFDMDAMGHDAVFHGGQSLQFLPGIKVTSISSSTNPIRFYGTNEDNLQLFTRGDLSNGIRLHDGEIELTNYGSIKLH